MNISRQFVTYMQSIGLGTFNTDIFIGGVPQDAPDTCYWIITSGGTSKLKNQTGEKKKNYILSVFYRSTDAAQVYNELEEFETLMNQDDCIEIPGYDIIETEATLYPTDQDLDNEDRTVGLVQVTLTVYL